MSKMNPFTKDYYENGPSSGLSNYIDYHWMPDTTNALAFRLRQLLRIRKNGRVLEIGCAKGFLVHSMRFACELDAHGYDISEYAVQNCHPMAKGYVSNTLSITPCEWDWVIGKDTLEHIPSDELHDLIPRLADSASGGMFFIVPLVDDRKIYLRPEDEADSTHQIRWNLIDWMSFFHQMCPQFDVSGSWCIKGMKPGAEQVHKSTGFFTLTRSMTPQ